MLQYITEDLPITQEDRCEEVWLYSSLQQNFSSNAKREIEILNDLGGKASERAYYRNRKREAKDFEKVYPQLYHISMKGFYIHLQYLSISHGRA